jgi:MoxR-like ATPase
MTSPPRDGEDILNKQEDTDHVDLISTLKRDLVQFVALAAAGDDNGARVLGMRRVREIIKTDPALAHSLRQALIAAPRGAPALRESGTRRVSREAATSNSADGGQDLLRVIPQPSLSVEPLYSREVWLSLESVVSEHRSPATLIEAGLAPARTVLLSGAPGVGKTLAATWLARELGKPLLVLDLGTVMSRYLGATGANLQRAVAHALDSDGVLFLDELDALAKRRDDTADVGELKRLVTVLLQQLDDWPSGRLLVAATNHPQLLDDAVWRRFEARIEFPRPSADELRDLMHSLTPPNVEIPTIWKVALPLALADTSQSEFVRAFSQLRKSALLQPSISAADALARVMRGRMALVSREDAKTVAVALTQEGSLSQRQIAELTHVSRDTIRRAENRGE